MLILMQECSSFGFTLFSPEDPEDRGSQVNFRHQHGYAIIQVANIQKIWHDGGHSHSRICHHDLSLLAELQVFEMMPCREI